MRRFLLTALIVCLVGVTGFLLPPQIMNWQDERRTMEISLEETQEILLAPQPALSITEKLNLYNKVNTGEMYLASGKNYDEKSIQRKIEEEIEKLRDLQITEIDMEEISYKQIQAALLVDTQESVNSMIVWNIILVQNNSERLIEILIDDETGKILEFSQLEAYDQYTKFKKLDDSKIEVKLVIDKALDKIAEKWGEYLELELVVTYDPMAAEESSNDKKIVENNQICCVYADEKEMVCYRLRSSIGDIQLSIEIVE